MTIERDGVTIELTHTEMCRAYREIEMEACVEDFKDFLEANLSDYGLEGKLSNDFILKAAKDLAAEYICDKDCDYETPDGYKKQDMACDFLSQTEQDFEDPQDYSKE